MPQAPSVSFPSRLNGPKTNPDVFLPSFAPPPDNNNHPSAVHDINFLRERNRSPDQQLQRLESSGRSHPSIFGKKSSNQTFIPAFELPPNFFNLHNSENDRRFAEGRENHFLSNVDPNIKFPGPPFHPAQQKGRLRQNEDVTLSDSGHFAGDEGKSIRGSLTGGFFDTFGALLKARVTPQAIEKGKKSLGMKK